jgi:hypothetical protein
MAIESVTASAGTGDGSKFAVDTITGSVEVPYVKLMSGTDAAEDLIGGDATNGLDVDVTRVSGTVAVSNAGLTELAGAINGSAQMDVNIAASNASVTVAQATASSLKVEPAGNVAHDAADSGNPIKAGAKATTGLSGATMVADADRTDLRARTDGVLITQPFCPLEDVVQERTTNTDGASTAFASGLAAPWRWG